MSQDRFAGTRGSSFEFIGTVGLTFDHCNADLAPSLVLQHAVLMVRPRGWHLPEKHILVDGKTCSGSLMDFALFFFNSAHHLIKNGSGKPLLLASITKMGAETSCRLLSRPMRMAHDMLEGSGIDSSAVVIADGCFVDLLVHFMCASTEDIA